MAHKTSGVTLRLDDTLLSRLRRESTQKQVSLNTLASRVFQSHADYEITLLEMEWCPFPKLY